MPSDTGEEVERDQLDGEREESGHGVEVQETKVHLIFIPILVPPSRPTS